MKGILSKNQFVITADKCFKKVLFGCAESRELTWLSQDKIEAYCRLHDMGIAHSVEVWREEKLVGGLFGVSFGRYLRAESMFTRVKNSSKIALVSLALKLKELNFAIIDCGIWPTEHLKSMGVVTISRKQFLELLSQGMSMPDYEGNWADLFKISIDYYVLFLFSRVRSYRMSA